MKTNINMTLNQNTMYEVEIKARVENLETIKQQLSEPVKTEIQRDHVYGFKDKFPPNDGECIARIREKNNKIILEFKEIQRHAGAVELKHDIAEFEPFHNFLTKLQFQKFFTMEKKREKYVHEGCTICLDTVTDLGTFVEIEKMVETQEQKEQALQQCKDVLQQLAPNAIIMTDKYGDLICRKLNIVRKS
jgi:adenylate cyclase, class 2